jgi:tRNA nucleotidyltransferase/poly(A) polymerase
MMENYLKDKGFLVLASYPGAFTVKAKDPTTKAVVDFVLARKETYNSDSRIPIVAVGTLRDDLLRRDFTLNAMALDENNNIIDLFNGLEDLRAMVLRTPLDPEITLLDDPLRMLRALRFAITKGMTIHDSVWSVMLQDNILDKMLLVVSKERIQGEVNKMFAFDTLKTLELFARCQEINPRFYSVMLAGAKLQSTFKQL